MSVSGLPSLLEDPGRSDWIKASDVGMMAAEVSPPASSSTSSERQPHPHMAPRDDVKVSAESALQLRVCVQVYL